MKLILAIILLACLIMPCIASKDTDAAYMEGLNAGYRFGYLAIDGQTNATAEQEYNHRVCELNAWMNQTDYDGPRWGMLPKIEMPELPEIFG
ncbi:hypothetical protein M0R72_21185 [Candidatus Pacearchaeota archaeon]|jgi:opacity protein-like surface antigen|nr:hypothetical protein [Candidatus Pacearchaeota archaeon]